MKTTDTAPAAPYIKPGSLGESPTSDIARALAAGDAEAAVQMVKEGRLHTFELAMAEKGIDRDDKRYTMAFELAMIWLYEHRPFYVYAFEEMVRKLTHDIDTLCVTIRHGRIELWANPDFMALHNLRQNVGFLQHEVGHIVQGHLLVAKKHGKGFFNDPINNIAMDLAVDSMIQNPGDQPDWVLLPSKLRVPDKNKPEKEWQTLPERKTWEYYRDFLDDMREKFPSQYQKQVVEVVMQRPHSDQQQDGDGQGGGGEGRGHQDQDQDGEGGGGGQQQGDQNGFPGQRDHSTMDDHRSWLMEGSDQKEMAEEVIKATVKSAYEKANNNSRCKIHGYMPGEMMQQIQEILKRKAVPFERILRMYIGSHLKVGRKPSMMKMSRRRRVPPGVTFERKLDVLWLRDTSGSMSDVELMLAFNELWHLNKDTNVRIRVQDFDYGLEGPLRDLETGDVKQQASKVYGRGGTSFHEPIKLAEELRPDVALMFTDGYAPFPDKPKTVPVGWIITDGGQAPPWGMVIRMPSIEEIKRGYKAVIERWS